MAFLRPALLALVVAMCLSAVSAHGGDDEYHYKHQHNKYSSGLKRITEALLRREEIVPDVIRCAGPVRSWQLLPMAAVLLRTVPHYS
jgi:hypothetical protein